MIRSLGRLSQGLAAQHSLPQQLLGTARGIWTMGANGRQRSLRSQGSGSTLWPHAGQDVLRRTLRIIALRPRSWAENAH